MIAALGSLELKARLVVEGFITGLHRSPFHGFSAEFAEHRQYRPGDDIKHIDWRIYGRSDRFYVKRFEQETNVRCVVAVDTSASMAYHSDGQITKFEYARVLSAALMHLLLRQRDAAGLALYSDALDTYLPPRSKPSYVQELLRTMSAVMPSKATGTATALHHLAERLTRRGMAIVISDLFDDPEQILQAFKHLRHGRQDVIVIHLLDPREVDFDMGAAAVFKDMETGTEITTAPLQLRHAYRKSMEAFTADIRRGCFDQKIDYVRITTDTPYDQALREFFARR